jgi:hypothetical protein
MDNSWDILSCNLNDVRIPSYIIPPIWFLLMLFMGQPIVAAPKVAPNDPTVNQKIKMAVMKASLPKEADFRQLKKFHYSHLGPFDRSGERKKSQYNITDLTPFAIFTMLEHLWLPKNEITDLTPLRGLTKLKSLDLEINLITDLTPLVFLTRMETLKLNKNEINNLNGLQMLRELKWLELSYNKITDLNGLQMLMDLKRLELSYNKITDLTPLKGMTKLEYLYLSYNKITDLTPLAGMKKLEYLELDWNPHLKKEEIEKLQKALPNCSISHSAGPSAKELAIQQRHEAARLKPTWTKKVKYFLEKNGGLIVIILFVLSWVLVKKKIIMKTTVIWTYVLLVIGYFFYFFLTMNRFTPSGFEPPTIWETIWDMFWLVICPLLCTGSFIAIAIWPPGGKGKGGGGGDSFKIWKGVGDMDYNDGNYSEYYRKLMRPRDWERYQEYKKKKE